LKNHAISIRYLLCDSVVLASLEGLRNLPLLDRKAALSRLLRNTKAGILLGEHIAEDGPSLQRNHRGGPIW
jgi:hypothetical protein